MTGAGATCTHFFPFQRYHELFLGLVEGLDQVGVTIADNNSNESIAVSKSIVVSNGRAGNPADTDREADS